MVVGLMSLKKPAISANAISLVHALMQMMVVITNQIVIDLFERGVNKCSGHGTELRKSNSGK
jgi:hypothetical protein